MLDRVLRSPPETASPPRYRRASHANPLLRRHRYVACFSDKGYAVGQEFRGFNEYTASLSADDRETILLLGHSEDLLLLRVNTLWKYLFSEPWRWLAGKGAKLKGWSMYKMGEMLDHLEKKLEEIVADPSRLLDPNFDMYESVAGRGRE